MEVQWRSVVTALYVTSNLTVLKVAITWCLLLSNAGHAAVAQCYSYSHIVTFWSFLWQNINPTDTFQQISQKLHTRVGSTGDISYLDVVVKSTDLHLTVCCSGMKDKWSWWHVLLSLYLSWSRHLHHKISVGHGEISHQTVTQKHLWDHRQGRSVHWIRKYTGSDSFVLDCVWKRIPLNLCSSVGSRAPSLSG